MPSSGRRRSARPEKEGFPQQQGSRYRRSLRGVPGILAFSIDLDLVRDEILRAPRVDCPRRDVSPRAELGPPLAGGAVTVKGLFVAYRLYIVYRQVF